MSESSLDFLSPPSSMQKPGRNRCLLKCPNGHKIDENLRKYQMSFLSFLSSTDGFSFVKIVSKRLFAFFYYNYDNDCLNSVKCIVLDETY